MEDWAEIRRLRRAERMPIKEISRRLGVARNTVRAALASDEPPKYCRALTGSSVDVFEPQIRALLQEFPTMPATVIAQRVGWTRSITVLKDRVREIRPQYRGVDPVDRLVHKPGQTMQCDLWFPDRLIPIGHTQAAMLPVLVMTLAYSRFITAMMIPTRAGGDILAAMWQLISGLGAVTQQLWWDRESAIGGTGKVSGPAAAFAGTLGTRVVLARPRDPEFKGMVERHNGYLETSFLPGRTFTGPEDFNVQLGQWLPLANARTVRSLGGGGRPADHLEHDVAAMTGLPPISPGTAAGVGFSRRVRLGREYYVRVDTCDYSVHPSAIGRFVDVRVGLEHVTITCDGSVVAQHARCWARRVTITDPAHVEAAARLRAAWQNTQREAEQAARAVQAGRPGARQHLDGHRVQLRALPDYDALFGVDFHPATSSASSSGVTGQELI